MSFLAGLALLVLADTAAIAVLFSIVALLGRNHA